MISLRSLKYIIIIGSTMLLLLGQNIFSVIGTMFTFYIGYLLFTRLNKELAFFELSIFVAGMQMVVLSYLSFLLDPSSMSVSEGKYMSITVPAYLVMSLSMLHFRRRIKISKENVSNLLNKKSSQRLLKYFYLVGLFFTLIQYGVSSQIQYIANLLSNLMLISAIGFLYTKSKYKFFLLILPLLFTLINAVRIAVFAEFYTEILIVMVFYFHALKLSSKKIIVIGAVILLLFSGLNTVKYVYRNQVWSNYSRGYDISLFFSLLFENDTYNTNIARPGFFERASAGYVISHIYAHVPSSQPYTKGKTLVNDLTYAIMPSIILPEKQISSQKNYKLLTGRNLAKNTSVGINAIGIGYGNFGPVGMLIFLFIYGWLCATLFNSFIRINNYHILSYFLLILMSSALLKFENEFAGVINSLIKSYIFYTFILFIFTRVSINKR